MLARATMAYSTSRMEFLVAMPISMISPIIEGMDSALWVTNSARNAPGTDSAPGAQDGHRLDEVAEQQHQHDVDAQHAGEHGQAEAVEQFAHASASPGGLRRRPAAGCAALGSAIAFACISPSGCWLSSISKLMLRWRS